MTRQQVMSALQSMGTAQNRKVYARHGAGENVFGVSFAELRPFAKRMGVDHPLAEELWATGNSDARTLATLIADPQSFTAASADQWVGSISYSLLADMLAPVIARSPLAKSKLAKWTRSRKEYIRQCGYVLLCCLLKDHPQQVDDATCRRFLVAIEAQIHDSPNRARHAMNMAVTAIGIYRPELREEAIASARRIGRVDVDHGETGCRTPDAEAYILKAAARSPSDKRSTRRRS
ncbi:MAG: DNA alkylation repair protein [Planctomycetaceae bacterium]|nr:DNA alkylation repair protein [Planctomycetaceae bacterium]